MPTKKSCFKEKIFKRDKTTTSATTISVAASVRTFQHYVFIISTLST